MQRRKSRGRIDNGRHGTRTSETVKHPYLDKVGWQSSSAVGVEVRKRSCHGRCGNSARDTKSHNTPPRSLAFEELSREVGVHQKICEIGVSHVGAFDVIEEGCSDDAATFPDSGTLSKVYIPLEVLRCTLDEVDTLTRSAASQGPFVSTYKCLAKHPASF